MKVSDADILFAAAAIFEKKSEKLPFAFVVDHEGPDGGQPKNMSLAKFLQLTAIRIQSVQ